MSLTPKPVLDDMLASGLRIVFCGTAPGRLSAEQQAYYAHPQNKFCVSFTRPALRLVGFDPMNTGNS